MAKTPWECPRCGCKLIRNRGNYAGNMNAVHDVQCWRCHCWYVEPLDEKGGASMTEDREEFSVVQFFTTGEYEYVRRYVSVLEAMRAFRHYTQNVAVTMGIVQRVIITDGGDCTNAEWTKDRGYTYPPELVELAKKGGYQ